MSIEDNLNVQTLINIALNNGLSLQFVITLYIIAVGDKSTYDKLIKSGELSDSILTDFLFKGYIVNRPINGLPVISKKTLDLFINITRVFRIDNNTEAIDINKIQKSQETLNVESWIQDYRNLFKGKKNKSMGNKASCITKMKEFVAENEFSKEQIMEATKRYVRSFSGDYTYMRQADYFIGKTEMEDGKKVKKSDLLTFCEELPEQNNSEEDNRWHGTLKLG